MTGNRMRRVLLTLTLGAVVSLPVSGQAPRIVYEVRSQYQLITVQDTVNGTRRLVFDRQFPGTGAIQSEMDLGNHDELTVSYTRYIMTALPLVEKPGRLLIVGLGGASMQRYLYTLLPRATIETVELDPHIRDIAARFFFLKEDRRQIVRVGDGRAFIERSKDTYDVIFLDAFNASSIPYALTTAEFLRSVKARLADGGVVCANVWSTAPDYADMLKTYAAVFPELHVVKCASSGNSIVLALPRTMGLTVSAWVDKARAFENTHPTGLDLPQLVERGAADKTVIAQTARVRRDR
jgi:spermidine synthase